MILSAILLSFTLIQANTKYLPDIKQIQSTHVTIITNDTITFKMSWDFPGDCGKDCYKFIGTGDIVAINGKPIGENCHHIFVKCPNKLNLAKGKTYKFIAVPFKPTDCSTTIDTCNNSKFYLLVSSVE